MDVVQASVPLFFLLIGLELLVARLRRRRVYRLNDSITDLSLGTMSQLLGIFIAIGTIAVYGWFGEHFAFQRFTALPEWIARPPFPRTSGGIGFGIDLAALASWGAVFLLDDLTYYWVHRSSHVSNLLWAGHVVHHSSEEYNLTVALRQSGLHGLFTWVFYLPLALLGIPVTMWVVCHGLNLIYQFWIHTREIDRLPAPLEWVLNTPSHHRVHHGINPRYQDKNYAGVLIVWDRMFGTFEAEVEPPIYGITKPLDSWNPVWANIHVFATIARDATRARSWGDRLRSIFAHPGWQPAYIGPGAPSPPGLAADYRPFDPPTPRPVGLYAGVQFLGALVGALALLGAVDRLPTGQTLAGVFYLIVTLSNIGAVLEGRSWAVRSEVVRLLVVSGVAISLLVQGRGPAPLLLGLALFGAGSVGWIWALRGRISEPRPR